MPAAKSNGPRYQNYFDFERHVPEFKRVFRRDLKRFTEGGRREQFVEIIKTELEQDVAAKQEGTIHIPILNTNTARQLEKFIVNLIRECKELATCEEMEEINRKLTMIVRQQKRNIDPNFNLEPMCVACIRPLNMVGQSMQTILPHPANNFITLNAHGTSEPTTERNSAPPTNATSPNETTAPPTETGNGNEANNVDDAFNDGGVNADISFDVPQTPPRAPKASYPTSRDQNGQQERETNHRGEMDETGNSSDSTGTVIRNFSNASHTSSTFATSAAAAAHYQNKQQQQRRQADTDSATRPHNNIDFRVVDPTDTEESDPTTDSTESLGHEPVDDAPEFLHNMSNELEDDEEPLGSSTPNKTLIDYKAKKDLMSRILRQQSFSQRDQKKEDILGMPNKEREDGEMQNQYRIPRISQQVQQQQQQQSQQEPQQCQSQPSTSSRPSGRGGPKIKYREKRGTLVPRAPASVVESPPKRARVESPPPQPQPRPRTQPPQQPATQPQEQQPRPETTRRVISSRECNRAGINPGLFRKHLQDPTSPYNSQKHKKPEQS